MFMLAPSQTFVPLFAYRNNMTKRYDNLYNSTRMLVILGNGDRNLKHIPTVYAKLLLPSIVGKLV